MAVHIEQAMSDLELHLRQHLPTAIAAVATEVAGQNLTKVPWSAPLPESYFVGEPSRFRAYKLPAIFLVADKTTRRMDGAGNQMQQHGVVLSLMMEDQAEERLTTLAFRYAEALDSVLHCQDISPTTPARVWSVRAVVRGLDYGVTFASTGNDRVFRKEVMLDLLLEHYDLLAPVY